MKIFKDIFKALLLSFILITISLSAESAPTDFKASAKVDSTTMIAGSRTMLNIDFAGPLAGDARISIDIDKIDPEMEINASQNRMISELGNNRKELKESFLIQVFDSGLYTLPPILCISGNDTVVCNSPVIRVDPIPLDTANIVMVDSIFQGLKIHPNSDLVNVKKEFFDFLPDWVFEYGWLIFIAIVVISVLIFVYFKWLRHGRIPLIPVKKPIPPYELAIYRLTQLQDKMLWQKGAEKEYYTELTDILRFYIYGRFGINAMEMTTPEILAAIAEKEGAEEYSSNVNTVLSQADFVKFAKARPQADENQRAFTNVKQFVELTKPVPETMVDKKNNSESDSDTNHDEHNVVEPTESGNENNIN